MATKIGMKRKSDTLKMYSKTPTKTSKKETRIEEQTKKELIENYKNLESRYEKVLKEKELLERTVKNMKDTEKINNESKSVSTAETQTESGENAIDIDCKICIYKAACVAELVWHIQSEHGIDPGHEYNFSCNICKKPFDLKSDLMYHVKRDHVESMPLCKYFQTDECRFTEHKCWYQHKKDNSVMNQYKCRICGNIFETKHSFMTHRKCDHNEEVKECMNYMNGVCKFEKHCWYIHSDGTDLSLSEY